MMMKRSLLTLALVSSGAAVYAAPAPVTDVNAGSLESRVVALERIVNSRTEAQHRIQAQLDTMQTEVNELRGTLETHNFQLEQILERQRELYQEIDRRIEEVTATQTQRQPSVTTPAIQLPVPQQPQTGGGSVSLLADGDAYDKAVNLILKEKKYDEAIPAFESFLQQYPNSGYAANAWYWLGQLYFNKGEMATAKQKFEHLAQNYADSSKRADSLLKLGMIAQRENNLAAAKGYFEQVVSEYSQSSAARLAQGRLKSLN